ncbi:PH domain-containing protein [Sinosporangium album]|uniref:PH domain-containing protein n=1 Tax=Sinosporangium album TaxID=504805 RepID=A0A1G7XEE1_9ACTN|nr:PH domain-containing protein [Sinosporangium album]SDG82487.1 PH domain-containing protein [Sinosporangium album]
MSDTVNPPPLPVVWRPKKGRIVAYGFAGVIVVGAVIMAVALPPPFKIADKIGVVAFGCFVAGVLHLLGRCRVEATDKGITLVNPLRVHRYEWPEVLDVTLIDGDPWAKIDFADGATIGAVGIQGSEHDRARRQVAELLALIRSRGEAPER